MRPRTPTLITLALAACASPAIAQQPPTIQVYSRETVVDVVVTDAKGQPVHNLKQSNFTIEEDGKPQPIRSLQEFNADARVPSRVAAKLPPNVYTNFQQAADTLNILLIDYVSNVDWQDHLFVMNQAAAYIDRMPPGMQVAVFGLSTRLIMLQSPTSDHTLLLKAVKTPLKEFGAEADPCGVVIAQDRAILEQLNQLAGFVSGIKGRKNLLWIGPGIPSMIFPAGKGCSLDLQQQLRGTYDLLGAAQVAIYPIDPRKVGNASAADNLAMEAVAEATGGEAFYNSNDLTSLLTKAVDRSASYYTLTYVPHSTPQDGKFHSITIKLDKPNTHIIYRHGYGTENVSSKISASPTLMQVAMSSGAPTATQLLFDARVTPSPAPVPNIPPAAAQHNVLPMPGKHAISYDVLFAVPASQIAFQPASGNTYSGSLEFDVAAYNSDGKLLNLVSQTMQLPLSAEEYQQFLKTPFQFFQQLDLPPGQTFLRVGILDKTSNKIGTLEIPLTVAKSPTAAVSNP